MVNDTASKVLFSFFYLVFAVLVFFCFLIFSTNEVNSKSFDLAGFVLFILFLVAYASCMIISFYKKMIPFTLVAATNIISVILSFIPFIRGSVNYSILNGGTSCYILFAVWYITFFIMLYLHLKIHKKVKKIK